MDKMADVLGRAGAWCGQNKYLSAIKNAFQNFMPLTIAGAIGVLWCNVLVNDQTGLGLFFKPIMALDFLNPAFQAVNFCTISCCNWLRSIFLFQYFLFDSFFIVLKIRINFINDHFINSRYTLITLDPLDCFI